MYREVFPKSHSEQRTHRGGASRRPSRVFSVSSVPLCLCVEISGGGAIMTNAISLPSSPLPRPRAPLSPPAVSRSETESTESPRIAALRRLSSTTQRQVSSAVQPIAIAAPRSKPLTSAPLLLESALNRSSKQTEGKAEQSPNGGPEPSPRRYPPPGSNHRLSAPATSSSSAASRALARATC